MAKTANKSPTRRKSLDPSSKAAAEKFREDANSYIKRHGKTKKRALAALIDLGLVTKTGRLKKQYKSVKLTIKSTKPVSVAAKKAR